MKRMFKCEHRIRNVLTQRELEHLIRQCVHPAWVYGDHMIVRGIETAARAIRAEQRKKLKLDLRQKRKPKLVHQLIKAGQ